MIKLAVIKSLRKFQPESSQIASTFREFVEWAVANCVKLWNKADIYQEIETHKTFKGVEKLYQYWFSNIKKGR